MTEKNKIEELTDGLRNYMNTNSELIKLEAAQQSTIIGSIIISSLIIGLFATLFLIFLSIWAGFYFSSLLNNNFTGFAIVACFYFLIMAVLIMARKQIVEIPIREFIIRKLFAKK